MIGTPFSYKGSTSALYPLGEYSPAPKRDKYLDKIFLKISVPEPV